MVSTLNLQVVHPAFQVGVTVKQNVYLPEIPGKLHFMLIVINVNISSGYFHLSYRQLGSGGGVLSVRCNWR